MQRSALRRSPRELSNAYLLAKFGFDTAENEPSKVCRIPRRRAARRPRRPRRGRPSGRRPRGLQRVLLRCHIQYVLASLVPIRPKTSQCLQFAKSICLQFAKSTCHGVAVSTLQDCRHADETEAAIAIFERERASIENALTICRLRLLLSKRLS